MPELSPEQRSSRARMGGYAVHARYDSRKLTKPARAAALARFERQVDPDGSLPPEELLRRAEAAKKAYFTGLGLKSGKARREARSER